MPLLLGSFTFRMVVWMEFKGGKFGKGQDLGADS